MRMSSPMYATYHTSIKNNRFLCQKANETKVLDGQLNLNNPKKAKNWFENCCKKPINFLESAAYQLPTKKLSKVDAFNFNKSDKFSKNGIESDEFKPFLIESQLRYKNPTRLNLSNCGYSNLKPKVTTTSRSFGHKEYSPNNSQSSRSKSPDQVSCSESKHNSYYDKNFLKIQTLPTFTNPSVESGLSKRLELDSRNTSDIFQANRFKHDADFDHRNYKNPRNQYKSKLTKDSRFSSFEHGSNKSTNSEAYQSPLRANQIFSRDYKIYNNSHVKSNKGGQEAKLGNNSISSNGIKHRNNKSRFSLIEKQKGSIFKKFEKGLESFGCLVEDGERNGRESEQIYHNYDIYPSSKAPIKKARSETNLYHVDKNIIFADIMDWLHPDQSYLRGKNRNYQKFVYNTENFSGITKDSEDFLSSRNIENCSSQSTADYNSLNKSSYDLNSEFDLDCYETRENSYKTIPENTSDPAIKYYEFESRTDLNSRLNMILNDPDIYEVIILKQKNKNVQNQPTRCKNFEKVYKPEANDADNITSNSTEECKTREICFPNQCDTNLEHINSKQFVDIKSCKQQDCSIYKQSYEISSLIDEINNLMIIPDPIERKNKLKQLQRSNPLAINSNSTDLKCKSNSNHQDHLSSNFYTKPSNNKRSQQSKSELLTNFNADPAFDLVSIREHRSDNHYLKSLLCDLKDYTKT